MKYKLVGKHGLLSSVSLVADALPFFFSLTFPGKSKLKAPASPPHLWQHFVQRKQTCTYRYILISLYKARTATVALFFVAATIP